MTFYMCATIIIILLMLSMTLHVIKYSGFTRIQKTWFIFTFALVSVCSACEFAVHCGYYDPKYKIILTIITVMQFSFAPFLSVFFSGALGMHKEAKKCLYFFGLNVLIEIIAAPFGWIFFFNENGYSRGDYFIIYESFYFIGLFYLIVSMFIVGKRFRHRDAITIVMVLIILVSGILPMTFAQIHIAYISIGICSSLCYIYYNDLVQEDIQSELKENHKDDNITTVDGLRIDFENGWVIMRPSGTEPKFRITSESKDQKIAENLALSFKNEFISIYGRLKND